jgi:hypothetical protein
MAEHPSRGVSYFKEERMEGIGWTPIYEWGRRGFVTFYFPHFIFYFF